jgi:hypothetical protein
MADLGSGWISKMIIWIGAVNRLVVSRSTKLTNYLW